MGNRQNLENQPLQIAFSHGFIYVQTDKQTYYPGQEIKGKVFLLINKKLSPEDNCGVDRLEIKLRGKESFRVKSF